MAGRRWKDQEWLVSPNLGGETYSYEAAQLTVLMDIRDELKSLNGLLHCHNFVGIPNVLQRIRLNTSRPKKAKAKGKAKA